LVCRAGEKGLELGLGPKSREGGLELCLVPKLREKGLQLGPGLQSQGEGFDAGFFGPQSTSGYMTRGQKSIEVVTGHQEGPGMAHGEEEHPRRDHI
jgi:hypothetical protein